jgi:hypothetical protein
VAIDLGQQVLSSRKVPVKGALADARPFGYFVEPQIIGTHDEGLRGVDDPAAVLGRVGAATGRIHGSSSGRLLSGHMSVTVE